MKLANLIKAIAAFAVVITGAACNKLTEDLKLVVDTDVIKHTALIQVRDASNDGAPPPSTTKITISGADADNIYEVSGKKNIKLVAGIVTIGPGPADSVTASNPAECTVTVSAQGYETVSKQITFTAGVAQQIVDIQIQKSGQPAQPLPPIEPPTGNQQVQLNFTGTCSSNPDLRIRPSIYIFYRLNGSGKPYAYLGYMQNGSLSTTALTQGKNYDFQLTYDNTNYSKTQLIQGSAFSVTIDMGKACDNF